MTILLFLVVLVALIVVHELGHLIAAKIAKMRVDEFGIGYPPRALTFYKRGGTDYTLNWLPFGGFVKIFGEDDAVVEGSAKDSFVSKSHLTQALVLVAGIAMNIVFAWLLFSISLTAGMPRMITAEEIPQVADARLVISRVVEGSPAAQAGLLAGDSIVSATSGTAVFTSRDAQAFTNFVASGGTQAPVLLEVMRKGETISLTSTPRSGIVPNDPERLALGVGVATVGTVSVPFWEAPFEGAVITWDATKQIGVGLVQFFAGLLTFSADLTQVAGPVGIAGAVGDASENGIVSLLVLTAIISINLALINLLPIPALDGGRLLFVIIEAITRKPIPRGVANATNTIGFALLILLMLVITVNDLGKLF
jgi:regulator of sigma E protease